jgi:segregation and condensation protein B
MYENSGYGKIDQENTSEEIGLEDTHCELTGAHGVDDSAAEALPSAEGTELEAFVAADIEEPVEPMEKEFIPTEQLESILESLLFVSDRPLSLAA